MHFYILLLQSNRSIVPFFFSFYKKRKINSNAYRLKLPSHIRTADVFNVKHLVPFRGDLSSEDDDLPNSWLNSSQPGEDDVDRLASSYLGRLEHPKRA